MKKQRVQAEIIRKPGSVFVGIQPPESLQQTMAAAAQTRVWAKVATEIASEERAMNRTTTSQEDTPTPEPTPTAEALLSASLPGLIEASRWGFYITYGSKSYLFDDTTLVYYNPSPPFWNLYNLAKGIFRNLGIRLAKSNCTWHAHIPIGVLTDKVFIESGLAGVERTLRSRTDDDRSLAESISDGIRHRQLADTKAGMAKVKQMREGLADTVGVVAIVGVSWLALIVCGGVV